MGRTGRRVLMVAVGGLLWSGRPLVAQGQRPGLVVGRVVDSAGAPVAGAMVEATALLSRTTRTSRTSDDGRYGLRFDIGEAAYEILVRSPGLVPSHFVLTRGTEHFVVGNVAMIPVMVSTPEFVSRPVSAWFSGRQP